MTPERLAELEQHARAASHDELWELDLDVFDAHGEIEACITTGPSIERTLLRAETGLSTVRDGNTREIWKRAAATQTALDATFIVAASPATVLDLIAHIRDLEAQLAAARENYGRHHSWCASGRTCDCARDAVRATATPPSPEVGE